MHDGSSYTIESTGRSTTIYFHGTLTPDEASRAFRSFQKLDSVVEILRLDLRAVLQCQPGASELLSHLSGFWRRTEHENGRAAARARSVTFLPPDPTRAASSATGSPQCG